MPTTEGTAGRSMNLTPRLLSIFCSSCAMRGWWPGIPGGREGGVIAAGKGVHRRTNPHAFDCTHAPENAACRTCMRMRHRPSRRYPSRVATKGISANLEPQTLAPRERWGCYGVGKQVSWPAVRMKPR